MQKSNRSKQNNHFEEKFEDSEANFSQSNYYGEGQQQGAQGQPIQLLKIRPNGKIEVNDEAINLIASYGQAIGFVSLVGKMRIGKSTLLNRLLRLSGKGFKVDPSTNNCTQGIWMWSEPQYNPTLNNYIFFLDTEGTDSLVKDQENDTKIFAMALLISSYFIYSSTGNIDERSLSQIQMVTALSKYIKTDQKLSERDNHENLYRYMPKFMWLLRDFVLKIEDQQGRRISATQYLENCLNDKNSIGKVDEHSKKIKKSIMNYFKQRECFTMVRPVEDEYDLQRLNSLPDHSLRREFIEGINQLREKIIINTGPKTYQGQPISGGVMASMIENYVEAFNSDKVPSIKSAWQQISEDEGAVAYNKALDRFQQVCREELPDDQPKGQQIYKIVNKLKEESVKEFENNSFNGKNQQYMKKLKTFLQDKEDNILEINSNLNQNRNAQILKGHAQKLRTNLESNKYSSKNKDEMKKDIEDVVKKYNRDARGEKKGDIIAQFMNHITSITLSMDQNKGQDDENNEEVKRKIRQMEKKDRLYQQKIKSLEVQLKTKEETDRIKFDKTIKDKKEKKQKEGQGCCSGGKCQIM